jgi:hypothetical protein
MKVWIYVEGESDRLALFTLWARWRESLRTPGWGVVIIPLGNKAKFFRKIGHLAAEKLTNNTDDLVIGLPDLYPNHEYENSHYKHDDFDELKTVQRRLVKKSLTEIYYPSPAQIQAALERFYPTALKHDLEMLLLAARDELRAVLDTHDALDRWRHPVEDQNQTRPPKYIVEDLFRVYKGRGYRDTVHAKAVLGRVTDINTILYYNGSQLQCPVFKELMDWIEAKTHVRAY